MRGLNGNYKIWIRHWEGQGKMRLILNSTDREEDIAEINWYARTHLSSNIFAKPGEALVIENHRTLNTHRCLRTLSVREAADEYEEIANFYRFAEKELKDIRRIYLRDNEDKDHG